MPPTTNDQSAASVEEYDPVDDGSALTTESIQEAIDAVAETGGGTVYVPPGEYLIGGVDLRSGITLHLEAGATLLGSDDIDDYDIETSVNVERDETTLERKDSAAPLVRARDADDVGIGGHGRILGPGEAFWQRGDARYRPLDELPVHRPTPFVRFRKCTGVHVRDISIENSPAWTLLLSGCDGALVNNLTIDNAVYGPNTDGVAIDACRNVRVSDSNIMSGGDDAIVLKNFLKGMEEFPDPDDISENITVTNCTLMTRANGVKVGTENVAGFRNVTISNCVIRGPEPGYDYEIDEEFGEYNWLSGLYFVMVDGSVLDGLTVSNVIIRDPMNPIFIRTGVRPRYQVGALEVEPEPGRIRNVSIDNVLATECQKQSMLLGVPESPIENLSLSNVRIEAEGGETDPEVARVDLDQKADAYPSPQRWDIVPSHGFYCWHVDGLDLDGIHMDLVAEDVRAALVCNSVADLRIDGLDVDAPAGEESPVRLTDVRGGLLRGLVAPEGTTVASVEGDGTDRIRITASDLGNADPPIDVGEEVPQGAVKSRDRW